MCVLAAAGGIVGFTRCTNTRVRRACSAGRRAASSSSSSPSSPILILVNGTKSPTASQWNVAPLGTVQPFVGAVKTGGVFIWACWSDGIPCQSGASAVSCQRLNKQQLICISLVPPLLHALLEELDFFIPPSTSLNSWSVSCFYCLDPSSLWDKAFFLNMQNYSCCPGRVTDGHVFPLFSGLECLIKKAWLGPLMSIWIKNTQWLLGHFPHFNWKPNVNPPHIN